MVTTKPSEPKSLAALKRLMSAATSEYAARKARAQAAVKTRAWATGELFSIVPYWLERRSGFVPKRLKAAPAKRAGQAEFGFDQEGRLRVIREHANSRGHAYETFVDWDDEGATSVRYDYDPKYKVASNVARLFVDDGRPTKYLLQSHRGPVRETYHYKGDRLVRIRHEPPGEKARVYRLSYGAKGLRSIDVSG